METDRSERTEIREEPPPILSSWNRVYAVVLSILLCLIVLFYTFTKVFE